MDRYKDINKHIADKNQHAVIIVTREYIQEFVKANYDRKLNSAELNKLSWLVWEEGNSSLIDWIDLAIKLMINDSKHKSKK